MRETRVAVGAREVGDGLPCFLIGELGVNHSGSLSTALDMVAAAARSGANAAKLQKRTPRLHAREGVFRESCAFPVGQLVTELQHREAMELSVDEVEQVFRACSERGMVGFASPWDPESVDALAPLRPPAWKVASPCVTDLELLASIRDAAKRTDAAVLCSTGMCDWSDVDRAVEVLGRDRLVLLHCVSTYPSTAEEANLRAIPAMRERYGVPVGYSGHELGYAVTLAAVALGACVVERHLTLDRTSRGSDHAASLEPQGFARMARDVRAIEAAMGGDGEKRMGDREVEQALRLRRKR